MELYWNVCLIIQVQFFGSKLFQCPIVEHLICAISPVWARICKAIPNTLGTLNAVNHFRGMSLGIIKTYWNVRTSSPSEYATRHNTRAPLENFQSSIAFLMSFRSLVFALLNCSKYITAKSRNLQISLKLYVRRTSFFVP